MATNLSLNPAANDLDHWRGYFINRVEQELADIAGTPWGFMCACVILEVLIRMTHGRGSGDVQLKEYETFARRWMPGIWSFRYVQQTVTITQHKKGGIIKRREKESPCHRRCI